MTECEMVSLSGPPDQINASGSTTSDRRVVMTYLKGEHPGVYTFVSGRLKVMDELPGQARPEPKKRLAKKPPAKKPVPGPAASVQ
jgi:hypothetical protein